MLRIPSISESERKNFESLLSLDLSTVDAELGNQIGVLDPTINPVKHAEKWLNSRRAQLHRIICIDGQYCEFIKNNPHASDIDIVAAIADILSSYFGAIPINYVAVALFKRSLSSFCNCRP